ncbi:PREDICTED: pentatricopeptide repeat-containing protein At1g06710, mitochondrial [Ipomoea nil]|uniref:pentatricopeptide repeat-containing protein At1g06710, mitochondrial n=1 Tax=Ipomoea nil TaxID=35883 RepID=UPI000901FF63|nr:PREDICTED: pentatricopeptide repeat-containing protein At1g06710, mitochondrial [Ipomoea nil]
MSRRNALSHLRLLRSFCRKATPPPPPLLDAFKSSSRGDDDHTRLPGLVADEDQSESHSFSPQEFAFLKDSLQGKSTSDGVDDVALSIISVLRENGSSSNGGLGDKTQKSLRQFREKLNPDLVVRVLRDIRNGELGVKFFMWAGRQIGYSHTVAVYDALIDLVVVSRPGSNMNAAVPENFLHDIMDDDKEVLGKLLNVLVLKCCRNGLWNLALEELGRLKNFGYKPSRVTYNALIQVFLQVGKLDSANLIYREMSGLGFKMDVHTLNCFTRSLCKGGKWSEALDLIEKEGLVADTVTYTSMISGLCEGSFFEEAMDFLNRMRSSSCVPNRITYETLLCACLNQRKLGRCKRILNMMILEGCCPSRKIFNSLVHAYCRSMDYSYAYKLLKKMDHCGCQPGYVVYNILIGGICGNEELPSKEMLELAEKIYGEMLDGGVVLNKVNVSNFVRCLCGFQKFEDAFHVIHEMMKKGFIPDVSTYSKVIGFLCDASKIDKAFMLFQEMKKNGLVPDVYTYTILIDSFCKAGLIQQARSWFDEMRSEGCMPNVVTYTALLHAYLKQKKISEANQLFELMLSEGCIPNVVTFTALIDGYCKAGHVEKACQIYAKMKGSVNASEVDMYFKTDMDGTEKPNLVTYGALVDGLCKAHKVKDARDLLDVISAEGQEPNIHIYDALIDGFCKVGKIDEAQEVFSRMLDRGYDPSVFTYSSFLDRLFKDKHLDLAIKVLSKMLESSCSPNVVIYTEMIDGLCKVGKTDEAYKLMLMMEEKGCHPNVVTYTAMIDGFGKAGKVEKCLDLIQQMSCKGCAPNYITYVVTIKHCCSAGLLDEAVQLLQEMKQTYWPRHMESYHKIVEGFNREYLISLGLLEEMSNNSSISIFPVYRILIDSFLKAGRLEVAADLHKEISSSSSFSYRDKNIYASLIQNLCLNLKVDKAFELYADMIKKGEIPEMSIFVNLIKGLILANQWENALELSKSLCDMDICWLPAVNKMDGNL